MVIPSNNETLVGLYSHIFFEIGSDPFEEEKRYGSLTLEGYQCLFTFVELYCLYDRIVLLDEKPVGPFYSDVGALHVLGEMGFELTALNDVLRKNTVTYDQEAFQIAQQAIATTLEVMNCGTGGGDTAATVSRLAKRKLWSDAADSAGLILFTGNPVGSDDLPDVGKQASVIDVLNKAIGEVFREDVLEINKFRTEGLIILPPVVATILHKAKSREDIGKIAAELRESLAPARALTSQMRSTLQSDTTPLKEKIGALRELRAYTKYLAESHTRGQIIDVVSDLTTLPKDIFHGLDATDFTSEGIIKRLVGKPGAAVANMLRFRKFAAISRIRSGFLKSSHKGDFERIFQGYIAEPIDSIRSQLEPG